VDPLEWILAFVDQISAPAKAMTGNIRELTKALKDLQTVANGMKPISLPGVKAGASGGLAKQTNEMQKFAAVWQKIGLKMQKDQAAALKAAEPGVSKAFGDMWQRIGMRMMADQTKAMKKAADTAAAAAEKASHKSYFGGHKSIGGLLGARASNKASGLATGAADALLGAPGALVSGAIGLAGDVVSGSATLAYNLGKASVAAQAMREDSVVAITQLFGSSDKANELFDIARQAAKETKLDTKDMIAYYTTLARSFSADETAKMAWTVADIESVRAGKGELFTRAIGKLKGGGPTAGFGAFQSAVSLGPEWTNVLPMLSQMLGKKKTLSRVDVQKMMRKGEIGTDVAIQSIVNATNKLLNPETGQAGEFAKKTGGSTWSGVISNIKNAMGDVLNMQLPASHPINDFKRFLQALGAKGGLFDSLSARGKAFEKIISDMVSDVFRLIGLDKTDINNTMDGILKVGKEAQQIFSKFVDFVRKDVYPAVSDALKDLNSGKIDDALGQFAARIGWIIAKGVTKGLVSAIYATENLGLTSEQAQAKKKLYDSTPTFGSRAASGGGVDIGAPESIPSFATGGVVPGPYGKPRLAIVHGGEAFMGLGNVMSTSDMIGGRGGGMSMSVTVQVMGSTGMDESTLKDVVSQGSYEGFMRCMEQAAAQQGAQR
jgi:hypothetical protein